MLCCYYSTVGLPSYRFSPKPNLAHLILTISWVDDMNQVSYNWSWSENLEEGSSPGTGLESPSLQ